MAETELKPITADELREMIRQASAALLGGSPAQKPEFSAEIVYEEGEIAAIIRNFFAECREVLVKTPAQPE